MLLKSLGTRLGSWVEVKERWRRDGGEVTKVGSLR